MEKIRLALIGAGDRGFHCYAPYVLENPWKAEFTAVADANEAKRNQFGEQFNIPVSHRFKDFNELLNGPKIADAILICTSDKLHYVPAMKAMEKGYHILLEKPMSTTLEECMSLWAAAKNYDKIFMLCFVLRYTEFFMTIKQIIDDGRIGEVNSIVHAENIPLIDQVHAFTRGIFSREEVACPIVISHCCHDLDLISWFAGSKCRKVASFGGLTYFSKKNAPAGAPERCLDGCKYSSQCNYYAPNYYLTEDTGWPTSTICTDMSFESRLEALKTGPYGRCVFHCDNDVLDNQTVIMEFENGVTANFSLQPFSGKNGRTLKIAGTKGEINADMEDNTIELYDIFTKRRELMKIQPSRYKYGGGDHGIMEYFTTHVANGGTGGRTNMEQSIEAHMMAFAAEKSRKENQVVELNKIRETFKAQTLVT